MDLRPLRVLFVTVSDGFGRMTISQDTERCRRLSHSIQQLDTTETEELFKMLHRNGCQYTTNNNGVFINLSRLNEDLLDKIEKYIEFCNESRQNVKRYESLCQVLCAGNGSDGAPTPSRLAKTPPTPSPPNMRYGGAGGASAASTTGGSKVSSSMKFYLLKKKYAKVSTPTPACKDELSAEPVSAEK